MDDNKTLDIKILNDEEFINGRTDIDIPEKAKLFGKPDNEEVIIYIHKETLRSLEEYSKADINNERGSVLIGDYRLREGVFYIVISGYIEAKYAISKRATLTFTHETWRYIHEVKENIYSEKRIVGWHHTHPGYGVYLSEYDLFIQRNFFNLPFQIAFVVDPINDTKGFFQLKDMNISKVQGYYVYD